MLVEKQTMPTLQLIKKTDEPKRKQVNSPRERKDHQQPDSTPLRQAASPKTYAGKQPKGCPQTCSRQACPPHSPQESYKRQVSTQYDSIQFCNSCSKRNLSPKLTELYSIKLTLLDRCLLFRSLTKRPRVGYDYLKVWESPTLLDFCLLWMD